MAMPWRSPPERLRDRRIDGDADAAKADRLLQDLVGDLLLRLDVDEAEAVGDLAADEEVAPERLLLGERLVLVDGLDREIVGHARPNSRRGRSPGRGRRCGPRSARSTPVITLISVDLPAPLSPIRPTISLRPMARLMSLSAWIGPKNFCTPSSRTTRVVRLVDARARRCGFGHPAPPPLGPETDRYPASRSARIDSDFNVLHRVDRIAEAKTRTFIILKQRTGSSEAAKIRKTVPERRPWDAAAAEISPRCAIVTAAIARHWTSAKLS